VIEEQEMIDRQTFLDSELHHVEKKYGSHEPDIAIDQCIEDLFDEESESSAPSTAPITA